MTKDDLITQAVESFKEKFKFTLFDGDAEKYNPPMFAVISFLTSKLAEAYEAGPKHCNHVNYPLVVKGASGEIDLDATREASYEEGFKAGQIEGRTAIITNVRVKTRAMNVQEAQTALRESLREAVEELKVSRNFPGANGGHYDIALDDVLHLLESKPKE